EGEEALRMAELALPVAHRTGFRLGAGLGAAAGAGFAGDRRRDADLRRLPGKSLEQRYFHIVAQVRATLAPGAAAAAAAHAEQIVENIREGGGEVGAKTMRATHAVAVLE